MQLVKQIEQYILQEQLAAPGDRILVAVSGGPDSVALLQLLHMLSQSGWQFKLAAAHVNHGFRKQESAQEAEFVRRLTERLGIPCEIAEFDLPQYIEETGMNSQAAAREKRYTFLKETAKALGMSRIALAHHADDQAETVLMRILRGTGPSGLAGILPRRSEDNVELIRPLLRIYKTDILQFCDEFRIQYVTDSSNAKRTYVRNRIRLDALPYLNQFNPELAPALNRLADVMRDEDRLMAQMAQQELDRLVHLETDRCSFSRNGWLKLHVALQRRLIKLILNYLSQDSPVGEFDHLERIRSAVIQDEVPTLSLDISGELHFYREYDDIRFIRGSLPAPEAYRYVLQKQGMQGIPEAGICLLCEIIDARTFTGPPAAYGDEAYFDNSLISLPLTVRSRLPGDRIQPLGLNGSKKVKDIFIDDKIAPSQRQRIPIVTDADGSVIWIPGVRRSRHGLIGPKTIRILHMKVLESGSTEPPSP